jgi:hypothetical protein
MARKLTDTVQLKLRFSEALRRRLEREARRQEQSLNAEIISRLEQSFRKAEDADFVASTFRAMFSGTGDLLRAIAAVIWLIERRTGKEWREDPETSHAVRQATDFIIDALAGPPTWGDLFRIFKQPEPTIEELERAYEVNKAEVLEALRAVSRTTRLAKGVALEALQKMGLAPSDAEIAAIEKRAQAQEAARAAQEVEKK